MIHFTIDGRSVTAQRGETILNVARREGIYIPTMCYLSKTTPCASCRLCVVECEGQDGFVLSCNTPPVEGLEVRTNTEALRTERTNIMRMYDVNHPLECGVCDKSGECDLQNKTMEFEVAEQRFTARDQARPIQHWGKINYDPNLCIMCEKCTHVCNEIIGDDAITLRFGGYGSSIVPKNADALDCTFCGECIAVCPVGALVSSEFQYTANAWELSRVPATCAHCSAGCALEYEVKTSGALTTGTETIFRVKNNFEFSTLCGAGRFGFDFAAEGGADEEAFGRALAAIHTAEAIRFGSMITNEEAMMLQKLKEKLGLKLFNEDARAFHDFMIAYSGSTHKRHYNATLADVKASDAVIVFASRISTDNPMVRYALTEAARHNGAKVAYMHPMEDALMQNVVTQHVKYEVGTEEGVMALLAHALLADAELSNEERVVLERLDIGYLSAESNVGEEEIAQMLHAFRRAKTKTLIVGSDVITHERARNIAALAGMIERCTDFKVVVVPRDVNTLGVSLICDLDKESEAKCVGYNAPGDFVIASAGECDLRVGALNQQEGTVVSIDKRVLPTNVAVPFDGFVLNDLACAFGVEAKQTVDYTAQLPQNAGFKAIAFDDLENYYAADGSDLRGYTLETKTSRYKSRLEDVEELPEYNGTVVYHCNPVSQFNAATFRAGCDDEARVLRGSSQFAAAAKISDGERVRIELGKITVERVFKEDERLKGTVALNPVFDLQSGLLDGVYRFEKAKITKASL